MFPLFLNREKRWRVQRNEKGKEARRNIQMYINLQLPPSYLKE
jgi:hypothetical protein